jgi:hypothetical protein
MIRPVRIRWAALSAGDWLFGAAIVAANVIPWGLFIWGLML